jgi:hypothetical protein
MLAVAVPASAARKPPPKPKPRTKSCNLVTDATGDAHYPAGPAPSQPFLDIVSGDVVSNLKAVSAVIRVLGSSPTDPTMGWTMRFRFSTPATPIYLSATYDPVLEAGGNPAYEWGIFDPKTSIYKPQAHVQGSYNATTHEFTITALFTDLHFTIPDSALLNGLAIEVSSWAVPFYGTLAPQVTDTAESAKSYKGNWPSCAKVGA